jgi:hypothetical protein
MDMKRVDPMGRIATDRHCQLHPSRELFAMPRGQSGSITHALSLSEAVILPDED